MNNEDNGYKTYCSRCGAEMNSNSRYCMKCGNLNYNHEANKNMRQFINEEKDTYQVGSGKFMVNNNIGNEVITTIGTNTGKKKTCFYVNFLIYVFVMFINLSSTISGKELNLLVLRDSLFPYTSILFSIVFLYLYSIQLIFMKCNKPWWSVFIPIYNFMVLTDILYQKKWLGLIILVPYVRIIFLLVIFYSLGKGFKRNGILTAIFPVIYIPIIAFGGSTYVGHNFVDNLSQEEVEKDYRRRQIFLVLDIFFIVFSIGLMIWRNQASVKSDIKIFGNYYYVFASERIVKSTQRYIKNKRVTCDTPYSPTSGVYYFEYADIGNYTYLPLYYQRNAIEGYVKVDNTSGSSKYYVSLSDGESGFSETDLSLLTKETVTNYPSVQKFNDGSVNKCKITKNR